MLRLLGCLRAAALVAAFLLPISAPADGGCRSVEDTVAAKKQTYPGSEVFLWLDGQEAQEFMGLFNTHPPVTDYSGDEVIGLRRANDPNLLILIFTDGCYTGRSVTSPEDFQKIFPGFWSLIETPT